MIEIKSINQLKEITARSKAALIYFFNDTCAPCVALRPKVSELVETHFPLMELYFCNAIQYPEIAADYGIFASPALLVYFEGKEYIRESKYISMSALSASIAKFYNMVFGL
ncbi:MAG TPA: thioredoxin family protein [Bacteroidales bacterium]|nr:thioredoxin family protein [Bacteroidales bacterium]